MFRKMPRKLLYRAFSASFFLFTVIALILGFFSWQSYRREILNPEIAAPENGIFVQAHDVKIFVQEAGPKNGDAILLIHGTGAWSQIWKNTTEFLAEKGYHVIAIDVPPFGFSQKLEGAESYSRKKQAERIIALLDSLNIKKITLVAHSVGARPAIEAVLNSQHRFQNLILVDPALGFSSKLPAKFEQNNPSFFVRAIFAIKPIRDAIFSAYFTNPIFTKRIFQSFVHKKDSITSDRVLAMQQPMKVKGLGSAEADWLEFLAISHDDSLSSNFENFKNIQIPTMILWGNSDLITPVWQGDELKNLIPNSHLEIIQNAGHIPYIENVEIFNENLLKFLIQTKSPKSK